VRPGTRNKHDSFSVGIKCGPAEAAITSVSLLGWQGMADRPNKESARAHYRRLAQECLEMVPTVQGQEGRAVLIEMARVWLRLAESYRDAKSILPAASKETRPVMQQQQQTQPKNDDS
jgi:hypothetical protein